ncbi:MAG: chloride channel protein [Actinobacteria bacterium]|nr:MAG: chloride channel protein [Actinomycetota bacterium]
MSESRTDSVTAARTMVRLFGVSVLIGVATGFATWLFIVADHYGVEFLWHKLPALADGVPAWVVPVSVVVVMTALAALTLAITKTRPFDMGIAEAEFDRAGRIDYRHLVSGVVFSLTSLFSGAAIGPEAPLTDINGGIGTFVADRLGLPAEQVKMMAYAGVAGAFSAFFGVAPVGALLAAELISPKSLSISRTMVVVGLSSGATGWVVYSMLGGEKLAPLLVFPGIDAVRPVDLALAVGLGALGGVIGLGYGGVLLKVRVRLKTLRERPWLAACAGGAVVAVAAVSSPFLLFSGQEQMPELLSRAAELGVLFLLGIGVAKLALNIWSLSTAYFGGPIFPVIFAGTCFGLALNVAVPGVPQAVAVLAIVTGMTVSAAVAPLSVTLFLALLADPALVSVIAIAAVASFIVRQLIAPTLPGIYRATRAEEDKVSAKAAPSAE